MCEEGRPFWEGLEDFQTEPPIHPSSFLEITLINFTYFESDPNPNILATNCA